MNIDNHKIKVISLKRREDRRKKFSETFKDYKFEFVDALDGQLYKMTSIDKELVRGNDYEKYRIHIPSLVCANKMHLRLLEECSCDIVPYVIFEDDTELLKPIDFSFEEICNKNLDAFWLCPGHPSILCYIVWPSGAKILLDWVYDNVKLVQGLDWGFHKIKETDKLRYEELHDHYFTQKPGIDSDVGDLPYYHL